MTSSDHFKAPESAPQAAEPPLAAYRHNPSLEAWIRFFWPKETDDLGERTRRRLTIRLIPWLFFLYFLAYLDRINVSVAKLQMAAPLSEGGLGFNERILGLGMGIFFVGYWILEVPSTLSVLRWGARYVFARILVLWGAACMLVGTVGTKFAERCFSWMPKINEQFALFTSLDGAVDFTVGWIPRLIFHRSHDEYALHWFSSLAHVYNHLADNNEYQFYFFRFLLGFFEGGFFPSVILYLSLWFPTRDRAKAIATFMSAIPISSMIGLPLCGLMLQINWGGLPGWRWVFYLQGLAPILAGVATLFLLPNRPHEAHWLPDDEKRYLLDALAKESHGKSKHMDLGMIYSNLGIVLLLTMVYFGLNVSSYGITMFQTTIVKSQLAHLGVTADKYSPQTIQLFSSLAAAPLWLVCLFGMLFNGWHSDKTGERIWHVALSLFGVALTIFLVGMTQQYPYVPFLILTFGVGAFIQTHLPAFWPIPTIFLGAAGAASAIGFINMVGNMGGFVGPFIIGDSLKSDPGAYRAAMLRTCVFPLMSGLIVLLVGLYRQVRPANNTK